MKYDIKLVYSFIIFSESKNIVEAAEKIGLSQPALSAHLKSFEEQFSIPLFTFRGKKKVLSPFGQEIYQQLKDKVGGIDHLIEQTALKFSDRHTAVVRIGGRREILTRILRELRFPGQIVAMDCDSAMGSSMVLKSQLDLLVSQERPDSLNLIAKPFFRDQFQILVPKKMKVEASSLTKKLLQQMSGRPFLSYKAEFEPLKRLQEHFGMMQGQYTFRVIEDWQALIDLCERGQGWTLAPTSFLFDEAKCKHLPVSTDIIPATQFYLIYPKSLAKTGWFSELVTSIQDVL